MNKKNELIDSLDNLDQDELEKVMRLASKFISKKGGATKPLKINKSQERTPRKQGRSEPRQPVQQEDYIQPVKRGIKRRGGNRPGKKMARSETVHLSGENKFDKMNEKFQHKEDTKTDKILWGNKKPTPRPEKYEAVEVQCNSCQRWFDINPALVYHDPDTQEVIFKCDGCVRE